ncbi:MAG: AIR synthase family protein [Candidatus Thermoplasmatota archaeon]
MAKLRKEVMDEFIFEKEITDKRVVMGPAYGEDAAVLKTGDEYMVVHSDPISGAVENIGWLAVNIAANDIAVTGASPRWMLTSLQLPTEYTTSKIKEIFADMYEASFELGVHIIGGHSEIIDGIDHPLVTSTMIGLTERPIFTAGAEPGDKIVQIDDAGIEGTWILASDFEEELERGGVPESVLREAQDLRGGISVVDEALSVSGKANSMHDPTEGGVLQGLYEMAHASKNRFVIDSEIGLRESTARICDELKIDPLRLISSGCLLATIPEDVELGEGKIIGTVEEGEPSLEFMGEEVEAVLEDELFKASRDL